MRLLKSSAPLAGGIVSNLSVYTERGRERITRVKIIRGAFAHRRRGEVEKELAIFFTYARFA